MQISGNVTKHHLQQTNPKSKKNSESSRYVLPKIECYDMIGI